MENAFETAVDALVSGDLSGLQALLDRDPALATARSSREHRATLLHYIAANGVENERQKTPANAPAMVQTLAAKGAQADALSQIYSGGPGSTPLNLTLTSAHPARAGNQAQIADALCAAGANPDGVDDGGGPVRGVLAFMYPPGGYYQEQYGAAQESLSALMARGARADGAFAAIALGRPDQFQGCAEQVLASETARARAFSLACLGGHAQIAALLLENRADVNGSYARGETGLHLAAATGQREMAEFLLDRGADPARRDERFGLTPLEWAVRFDREEMRTLLEGV